MAGRILLIEADVILGAVLEEVLQHSGYEVIVVKTLLSQVEQIPSAHVVILDMDTTAADKEVAWLDAQKPEDQSLPIVLIGVQAPEDSHHLLRVHFSRRQTNGLVWVQKPFQRNALLAAVRQVQENSCRDRQTEYERQVL